jgi:hypothetical protein
MALEFKIELGGNFVGALQKGNKELGETEKRAHGAGKEMEFFEGELGKIQAGALSLNFNAFKDGGHFLQFDLAEGAKIAFEAISKVVEKVIDLGKEMVFAAAKAEDLNLAVKLDVGEGGAKQVDELTESFKGSRFDPEAIKEALLPVLEESGNKNSGLWDDLATAATDVATRRNTGIAGAKAALESLNDIELNPQRLRGSLKQLGIKQLEYYKDLGSLLGISEKEAEKQTKAGKVKSQTLLSVALNQIAQREGGALGQATNEGSKTLGASIERLGNLKDNLFRQLAGGEGMGALQGAIDNFVAIMQGPVGTDLMNTIDGAFKTLFGDLSGPDGAKRLEAVIGDVVTEVKAMIEWFRGAWPDIKAGAEGVWEVLKGIAKTVGMIVDGWVQIRNFANDFDSGRINKDIIDTIRGDHGGIAGGAVNDNSPQWKKDRAAAAGVPAFADGGLVNGPTLALIGENGPEAVVPLGRSFGSLADSTSGGGMFGGINVNYAPQFSFGGAANDVRGQIENFEQMHRVEMKKLVDEIRAAVGG